MDEGRREELGFEFAKDAVKQLIALATGVVALTATFSKDFLGTPPSDLRSWAIGAWICLLISIICGCWCLLALAGHLGSSDTPSIYDRAIKLPAFLQIISFVAGLIATVRYAVGML